MKKMSKAVIRLEKIKTLREIAQRELHNTRGKQAENSNGNGRVIIEEKFNYSKFINVREDLSGFQQLFEEFIYDIERRELRE